MPAAMLPVISPTMLRREVSSNLSIKFSCHRERNVWEGKSVALYCGELSLLYQSLMTAGWPENTIASAQGPVMDVQEQARALHAVMLRELNHRAKNMLQMVASVLMLEMNRATSEDGRQAIARASGRLQMMSHVHSLLYMSGEGVECIDMQSYLEGLCPAISKGLLSDARKIACHIECEAFCWPIETAGQVGMIVAETLINAYKHAFAASDTAKVDIKLYARDDAHVQLEIADNGCGFIPATGGVGSALVRSFADNLQAKLQVLSNPGGGTRVMLSFPLESVPLSETGTTSEGLPRGGCALE